MKNRGKCARLPLIYLQWQQASIKKKKKTVLDYTIWPAEKNAGAGGCQDDIREVMYVTCGREPWVVGSYIACIEKGVYLYTCHLLFRVHTPKLTRTDSELHTLLVCLS